MDHDITLSPLRLAILGLVAMRPQSGYDLKKVFETTPMGNFSSSPGAIYPALKGLEKKSWIRGVPENAASLRPRLVYSITEEGEAVLSNELRKPVTHEALIWHFDLVMLRFAFIDRLGHEEALRFLGEFRSESEAYVWRSNTASRPTAAMPAGPSKPSTNSRSSRRHQEVQHEH